MPACRSTAETDCLGAAGAAAAATRMQALCVPLPTHRACGLPSSDRRVQPFKAGCASSAAHPAANRRAAKRRLGPRSSDGRRGCDGRAGHAITGAADALAERRLERFARAERGPDAHGLRRGSATAARRAAADRFGKPQRDDRSFRRHRVGHRGNQFQRRQRRSPGGFVRHVAGQNRRRPIRARVHARVASVLRPRNVPDENHRAQFARRCRPSDAADYRSLADELTRAFLAW